jgi:polysaccharide biosynthesis transport protein
MIGRRHDGARDPHRRPRHRIGHTALDAGYHLSSSVPPDPTESELPLTFHDFLAALWRRKLTIVVSVVVAVAASFAYSKVQHPQYQSTALVQLTSASSASGSTTSSAATLPDPLQLLGSTAVQLQAAKTLGDANVAATAAAVTGTVDQTTGALSITASDPNAKRAQDLAKAYSQAFVDQTEVVVQGQIDKITTAIGGLAAKISALEAESGSSTNALVQAQITAATQTYSTLQTQQYAIQTGEPYASIQVAASLPTTSSGLSNSKIIAIGFLAGLLAGIGIALARDQFDTRLRTTSATEAITDSPILAELPEDSDVKSGKVSVALVQAPQSLMAESIRDLRTSLRVIFESVACPIIVVTSPEPGDGKSFVTANLAAAWALSGSKVIVVSADFRRPRLEHLFGLQATGLPGLADLIRSNWKSPADRPMARREVPGSGHAPVEQHPAPTLRAAPARDGGDSLQADASSVNAMLVETGIQGLKVLPAGTELDSPSDLFGSPGMQPVLDQLQVLADVVLLDTPPVLPVPDTAILGRLSNGAVVIASEGRTDKGDLERTIHRLETTQCRVLGVTLNRVRRSSTETYQSYAYKQ